jgi:hypothetical protein
VRLAWPDWLAHRLLISGPTEDVAAFSAACAGSGATPWQLDYDAIEEEFVARLLAPPDGGRRPTLQGARALARRARARIALRHERLLALSGTSRACPLDLHALIPVPGRILVLGPDAPESLAWLWSHWGTTRDLRQVRALPPPGGPGRGRSARLLLRFEAADWSPWPAIAAARRRWPALVIDLRAEYGAADG